MAAQRLIAAQIQLADTKLGVRGNRGQSFGTPSGWPPTRGTFGYRVCVEEGTGYPPLHSQAAIAPVSARTRQMATAAGWQVNTRSAPLRFPDPFLAPDDNQC